MGLYIGLYRPTYCCWFGLRQRCLLVLSVWISSSFDKWKTQIMWALDCYTMCEIL